MVRLENLVMMGLGTCLSSNVERVVLKEKRREPRDGAVARQKFSGHLVNRGAEIR